MYSIDFLQHSKEYQLNIDLTIHDVDYNKLVDQYKGWCHCIWMECNFEDTLLITGKEMNCVCDFYDLLEDLKIIKEVDNV